MDLSEESLQFGVEDRAQNRQSLLGSHTVNEVQSIDVAIGIANAQWVAGWCQ